MNRHIQGGTLAVIGFLLSPLSWWNDLFINVPLALGMAWLVSLLWPGAFAASFVAAYWFTNVLGLVLLHKGTQQMASGKAMSYSRRELLRDLLIALLYTGMLLVLVKLRVLQPIQEYFPVRE